MSARDDNENGREERPAAVGFREQAQIEPGSMALFPKKRDRRTIEEIQRDMMKHRSLLSTASSTNSESAPSASMLSRTMATNNESLGGSIAMSPLSNGHASPPKSLRVEPTESRFRTEPRFEGLGPRKRDHRTIEEIQRAMQKHRSTLSSPPSLPSSSMTTNANEPLGSTSARAA